MDKSTTKCSSDRVRRFAAEELSAAELAEFEDHLEACEGCRGAVESWSGEPQWWNDARQFLSDDEMDLVPLSTMVASARDTVGSAQGDISAHVHAVLKWLTPSDDPQRLGRVGTYEIAGVIGSGGMGVVLKGFDAALNRYVAIKVLSPHMATGGAARLRFAREAQAAAAIVHENVIAIHGVAEVNGLPYLVMPYERGHSLQKRIADGGPLSVAEILRIGMQAAAGLAAAHAQGLVHRDVKPANILLADGVERVTLTDFGLARAADDATITHTGFIAGTPQYMSPEQVDGGQIDHRSDLFSLGSVLYAMCTGRPPFRASTSYGLLKRVVESNPVPVREINPDIPDWLCLIIDGLHQKNCELRFQSSEEVRLLLEQCLLHVQQPTTNPLPDSVRTSPRPVAPKRFALKAVLVVVIAVACLLIPTFWPGDSGAKPNDLNTADAESAGESSSGLTGDVTASAVEDLDHETPDVDWDDGTWTALSEIAADVDRLDRSSRQVLDRTKPATEFFPEETSSSKGEQ